MLWGKYMMQGKPTRNASCSTTSANNVDMFGKRFERLCDIADLLRVDGIEVDKEVIVPLGGLAWATVGGGGGQYADLQYGSPRSLGEREREQQSMDLRLDTGKGDVHGLDGGKAVVQSTDLVRDGEVDGGLEGGDRGIGALVQVGRRMGGHGGSVVGLHESVEGLG